MTTVYALFLDHSGERVQCRHAHGHRTLTMVISCRDAHGLDFPAEIRHCDGSPLTAAEESQIGDMWDCAKITIEKEARP